LSPIDGCTISLDAISSTILTGQSVSRDREALYAALLDHPKCPKIEPQDDETLPAFMTRVFSALAAERPDAPFAIELLSNSDLRSEYGDELPDLRDDVINAVFRVTDGFIVDIQTFDETVKKIDPLLAASLIANFGTATRWTFDVVTPFTALDLGDIHYFSGDGGEWMDMVRDEAAHDAQPEKKQAAHDPEAEDADDAQNERPGITNAQLRAYIKNAGIRTPGRFRRDVGAHYARIHKKPRLRLSPEQCRKRIGALPTAEKSLASGFMEAQSVLQSVSSKLKREMSQEDYDYLRCGNESYPHIGLVFENDAKIKNVVTETVNDMYDYLAQDEGFAPNYALVVHAQRKSVNRLFRVLDLMQTATTAMWKLIDGINAYNGAQ
jgi:hypothetical protein